MLQNVTLLAIVAIHTAANEPPKVRQVMNKIHRNVGRVAAAPRTRAGAAGVPLPAGAGGAAEISSGSSHLSLLLMRVFFSNKDQGMNR